MRTQAKRITFTIDLSDIICILGIILQLTLTLYFACQYADRAKRSTETAVSADTKSMRSSMPKGLSTTNLIQRSTRL